jgi:DNA-binding NarL/FixJ family response regulator
LSEDVDLSANEPVRVLVVDDHRTFAEALALAMEGRADMRCTGIAAGVDEALQLLADEPCDVVLMDVALHGVDGIEGTRRVRRAYPETRVLVMTGHLDATVLARAVEAGAAGFLPKDGPFADLVDAVVDPPVSGLAIGTGTPMAVVAEAMRLREQAPPPHPGADSLTPREIEVLGLLAEGLSPAAVARRLGITLHTCRGHIKSVLAKLEVHSQLEAVVVGWHRGLVRRPGEP